MAVARVVVDPADLSGAASAAAPARRLPRVLRRAGDIAAMVVGALALALLAGAAALVLTGHRVTTVLTGSMQPGMPPGTLVLTERITAADVRAGDVIVFSRPGHADETIIHRVTRVEPTGDDAVQVHTRGDANAAEDPWILRAARESQVDRAQTSVRTIGTVISVTRRWAIQAIVVLVVGGLAVGGLRRIWHA